VTGRVKVFLSYRRADTQHVAGRAADRLADRFELFMDMDTIPPGVDFTDYVRRAVGNCDVLLAFIGERWLSMTDSTGRRRIDDPQDWVVQEITAALHRGVPVIPVLVDDATMPSRYELPEALAALANRQAVPLRYGSFSADLTRLMAGIDHAGADHPAVPPQPVALSAIGEGTMQSPAGAEPFAERWERTAHPAAPPIAITIPEAKPRKRLGLVIGLLVIVIAAVLGVVLAIFVVNPGNGRGAAGTSAMTASGRSSAAASTPRPKLTPATTAEQLRHHVPAGYRETCSALVPDPAALRAGLRIAVQCVPGHGSAAGRAPEYSFYFQYGTVDAATAAFRGYYAAGKAPEGDCTAGPAEQSYSRGGGSGTLRCYTDSDGYRVFAWTTDELGILASVADRSMSYAELAAWWRDAGPNR
jgi:TIR domain